MLEWVNENWLQFKMTQNSPNTVKNVKLHTVYKVITEYVWENMWPKQPLIV